MKRLILIATAIFLATTLAALLFFGISFLKSQIVAVL